MANIQDSVIQREHVLATTELTKAVANKARYLQTLAAAIQAQDDRLIYQLIDGERYSKEIQQAKHGSSDERNEQLVLDISDKLSQYLSGNLIAYLHETYPFFYFEQTSLGHFQFYFGNWWDRRLFGTLDVLKVRFDFDQTEYKKLELAFKLEVQKKRLNSDKIAAISQQTDQLQSLIDSQDSRDQEKEKVRLQLKKLAQDKVLPWEASKAKEAKQKLVERLSFLTDQDEKAQQAYKLIRESEEKVLALSKEDTLIGYEKQSIVAKFGGFENFTARNASLYRDYIADLIATKGRVKINE
ncbi:exonuclease SbcC [Liquorilactobacillus uvarum]|uniref:exonuclease SbcC n=1 Tax=Liquorilactobacillus uvarum TaxID=303240 RepID=UPI00288AC9A9|nr:exonuclease SbcC [Liquorilactobacillus uvarum]